MKFYKGVFNAVIISTVLWFIIWGVWKMGALICFLIVGGIFLAIAEIGVLVYRLLHDDEGDVVL
jgi:high-affinity Fe2+/Pb2+ permease